MANWIGLILISYGTGAWAANTIQVDMVDGNGKSVGKATIEEIAKGVKIDLDLKNLPPGPHGFHVHEKADCVGPKFESAGGHFNPNKHEHGFDTKGGFHDGDMSNVVVAADGTVKTEVINTSLTLGNGPSSLLNKGAGTSLILHQGADDYKSQPAGNAGARLACGKIKRP